MSEFSSEEQRSAYVLALLSEHARYVAAGLADRAREVEAELARVGHVVEHLAAKPRRAAARKAVSEAASAAEVRSEN